MVRRRAGLLETDDAATTRAGVAAMLAEHVPDPDERRWIEPALLSLLGVETGVGSEQLFGAWRTFFERLAATAPVVLVFEDFHFADTGLIDFVDHLMEWSRHVPIYVVTLSRPELLEKRPDWGAGKRNFTSLYLEPLSAPAMRELLAGLVAGLPEAAVRAIVARADGIPLYAVETVRMLLAEGRLAQEGDAYRPTGDLDDLAVPETLTALIASRLDALEPADRALLQDAAVLGQSFTLAGLGTVSGVAEADLEGRLRSLVPARVPAGGGRSALAGARPVRVRPGAHPRGRLQHAGPRRPQDAPPRRGPLLRGARVGRARRRAGQPLPRGACQQRRRPRARRAGRPGPDRPSGGGRPGGLARRSRAGAPVLRAGADRRVRPGRPRRASTSGPATRPPRSPRVEDAAAHYRAAIELRARRSGTAAARRASRPRTPARSSSRIASTTRSPSSPRRRSGSPTWPTTRAWSSLNGQLARAYFMIDENAKAVAVADRVLAVAERSNLVDVVADTLVTRGSALAGDGRGTRGSARSRRASGSPPPTRSTTRSAGP